MPSPLVAILMGSDSDLKVMSEAAKVLEEFGVAYEITVLSAHRTPDRAREYSKSAVDRGLKVIIASAGGAAHLAGAIAANTTLPIIGVPINWKLSGLDALLSTMQMPPGVPVATVGVDGGQNAGILAVQILGTGDEKITAELKKFKEKLKEKVLKANEELKAHKFENRVG